MTNALFDLSLPVNGRTAQLGLRLARWGEIAGVALSPLGAPAARLEMQLDVGVRATVATVDGRPAFEATTRPLLESPEALATILECRSDLYDRVQAAGRLFAQCPQCGHELELALLGLINTLRQIAPRPFSADRLYFAPPIMGTEFTRPERRDLAYAARLRFQLPTAALGLPREGPASGYLQPIDWPRATTDQRRWATDGVNAPIGRAWWADDSAAFRATIRLGVAMHDVSPAVKTTPSVLERLPAVDFYFLDALYWYTHCVIVPDHAPARPCPSCKTSFLPVASLR